MIRLKAGEGWFNMIKLNVKGTEYKIKFGYKALAHSNVIKDVLKMGETINSIEKQKEQAKAFPEYENEDNNTDYMLMIDEMVALVGKMMLAGLQRYHSDVFGYDPEEKDSIKAAKSAVDNFIDDYIDEEDSMSLMDLFNLFQEELFNNGFLFGRSQKAEETLEEQNATIAPTDHKKKQD